MKLKLSRPKESTFLIAVMVAIVAIVLHVLNTSVSDLSLFWVMVVAFAILAAGNLVKSL